MKFKLTGSYIIDNIEELGCFLNMIKENLPFDDMDDFTRKITESRDFRIKVQKLVYLSKFFGWENEYHFNFHPRGPYSIELSEDYTKIKEKNLLKNDINLNMNEFGEFIRNENIDFLETASTILYYLNKIKTVGIDENKITEILNYIKPHISSKTVKKAFKKIIYLNLINNPTYGNDSRNYNKKIIFDKIDGLQGIFINFESCSNQTLILGSLDYLKLALKKEDTDLVEKKKLIDNIYNYIDQIEIFYFNNYKISENFSDYDLTSIDESFNVLQDCISNLKIIPKLYDEDVDLNIFYE